MVVFSWCFPTESMLRLTRGGCRCTGILEVNWENQWRQICSKSVSMYDMNWICQRLECGPMTTEPLEFIIPGGKRPQSRTSNCNTPLSPLRCHWELENCTEHAIVTCGGESGHPAWPPQSLGITHSNVASLFSFQSQ